MNEHQGRTFEQARAEIAARMDKVAEDVARASGKTPEEVLPMIHAAVNSDALARYVTDAGPDESERYALYRLCECPACKGTGKHIVVVTLTAAELSVAPEVIRCDVCRGEGRTRDLIATCRTPEALGVAIVTLAREGEWEGCPIGILDTLGEPGEKWLVRPWLPSARNISEAGRTLAKAKHTAAGTAIPKSVQQGMDMAAEAEKQAIIKAREEA